MERDIKTYKGHTILCGCGRTGSCALEELIQSGQQVVVIEQSDDVADNLTARGIPVIRDDATREDVLEKARVTDAGSLIASLPDDADNVFVALTAREMAPHLVIVARASEKKTESKLRRAGATRVILVNEVAGNQMANVLLRPDAVNFINTITGLREKNVGLREITITSGCLWDGKSLAEMRIRAELGLNVVAIRKSTGDLSINPDPKDVMHAGDVLITFGPVQTATELNERFASQASS